jgi:L-lysine exporter family protein LysE/ArgO
MLNFDSILLTGFLLNFGLVLSISPQGLYVLREGIYGRNVFWVATTCCIADALFVTAGTLGVGTALAAHPLTTRVAVWISILFLSYYGLRSFRAALSSTGQDEDEASVSAGTRMAIVGVLAVTLLDPCVYTDTLLVLGGASAGLEADLRLSFTAGVILSSTLWFYGLGWFGRRISRLVSNKRTRVGFDLVSAFATWGATLMLIADVLQA